MGVKKGCCGAIGQILDPGSKASPPLLGIFLWPLFPITTSSPLSPLLSFSGLPDLASLLPVSPAPCLASSCLEEPLA